MTATPRMTKGFTKKTIDADATDEMLNTLGSNGWQLISVVPIQENMGWSSKTGSIIYYLMREIA